MQQAKVVEKQAKVIKQEKAHQVRINVRPLIETAKASPLEDFEKGSIDTKYFSSIGTKLAFASLEKKRTLTTLLTCKDYFQQAYWMIVNESSKSELDAMLAGVLRREVLKDCDPEKVSFLVITGNDGKSSEEQIENALTLIHEVESKHGFEPTKLAYVGKICVPTSPYNVRADEGAAWLFTPSPRWFLASPLLSLYIMLIRSGTSYGGEKRELGGEGYVKYLEDTYMEGVLSGIKDHYYFAKARNLYSRIFAQPVEEVFGSDLKKNYPADRPTPHQEGYHWMGTSNYQITFPHWKKI